MPALGVSLQCTFFCTTCSTGPHSVCQHCMGLHAGHQVIQVRT